MAAVRSSSRETTPPSLSRFERHLDHADRALHDARAGRHHGVGLLPAQHGLRDLLGVGQVGDPHLDDLDAGDGDPLRHLGGQLGGHHVGGAAQRRPGAGGVVVGMAGGDVAQGRLGLHRDEVHVVVDGVRRLGGVGHLPDHDGGDLDRVAVGVVDLQMARLEVADPDADPAAHRERRQHPPEPGPADRADVAAEELDHRGLARRDDGQRRGDQDEGQDRQPRASRCRPAPRRPTPATQRQQDDDAEPSAHGDGGALADVDPDPLVPDRCGGDAATECSWRAPPTKSDI